MTNRINLNSLATMLKQTEAFSNTPKYVIRNQLETVFATIRRSIASGDSVAIPDFGKFQPYEKLNGKRKPKFVPYRTFKEWVN